MNLGQQLREENVKAALDLVMSLPANEHGVPRYSRNKDLRKWQAEAHTLAVELRGFPLTQPGEPT